MPRIVVFDAVVLSRIVYLESLPSFVESESRRKSNLNQYLLINTEQIHFDEIQDWHQDTACALTYREWVDHIYASMDDEVDFHSHKSTFSRKVWLCQSHLSICSWWMWLHKSLSKFSGESLSDITSVEPEISSDFLWERVAETFCRLYSVFQT